MAGHPIFYEVSSNFDRVACLNSYDEIHLKTMIIEPHHMEKVQVGKDQEKAQSEKDSHSKNQGGKNQTNNQVLIP